MLLGHLFLAVEVAVLSDGGGDMGKPYGSLRIVVKSQDEVPSEKINTWYVTWVLCHRDHSHIVEEGQQDDVQGVQCAVKDVDQNTSSHGFLGAHGVSIPRLIPSSKLA